MVDNVNEERNAWYTYASRREEYKRLHITLQSKYGNPQSSYFTLAISFRSFHQLFSWTPLTGNCYRKTWWSNGLGILFKLSSEMCNRWRVPGTIVGWELFCLSYRWSSHVQGWNFMLKGGLWWIPHEAVVTDLNPLSVIALCLCVYESIPLASNEGCLRWVGNKTACYILLNVIGREEKEPWERSWHVKFEIWSIMIRKFVAVALIGLVKFPNTLWLSRQISNQPHCQTVTFGNGFILYHVMRQCDESGSSPRESFDSLWPSYLLFKVWNILL